VRKIFLFDLNGTLVREGHSFEWTLEKSLKDLMDYGEIGILTGGDMNMTTNTLGKFLEYSSTKYHLHILPCNGTQWYTPPPYNDREYSKRYGISMEDYLGYGNFQKLMKLIVDYQSIATDDPNIKMKGSFINNRGPMINWCPIGRASNTEDRESFRQYDRKVKYRERTLSTLRKSLMLSDFGKPIDVRYGGSTSFDIFPEGWDKSFALNHFPNKEVWFIGASCEKDENDKEIYDACGDRSYITTGPQATIDVIYDIISRIEKEKDE
jgi:phosphomannomutase